MGLIIFLLQTVSLVVLADALFSWIVAPEAFPRSITSKLTEPLYAPIRAVIPPQALGIDLSPLIVILACNGVAQLLAGLA